jgi:protein-L-isoaspartate O-methyltransferase
VLLDYAAPERGENVLDVATGMGSVARHVSPIVGEEGCVVAVDINRDMLVVARALPPPTGVRIEWHQGDAMKLELPNQAFDLVLCQQGLQFEPCGFAARDAAGLRLEGRAAFSVWWDLDRHLVYKGLFEATAYHPARTSPT